MQRIQLIGLVVIAASSVLAAANFWDEESFTTWSEKEVEEILTDSPWSQGVTIALRGRQGGGGGRGGGGGGGGGGVDRLGGRGGGRGAAFNTAPPRLRLTVSWRSALPVKQALVRTQSRNNETISSDQEQFLDQTELSYVVFVSGFPLRFNRLLQDRSTLLELLDQTSLQLDDRNPIVVEDARAFVENEETVSIEYLFSREHAITLDDRNVEFVTKVGPIEVKKKFKLEDMVFADELSL